MDPIKEIMQGTTPTHIFSIPIVAESVKTVRVVYAQNKNVVLKKEGNECRISGKSVSVSLTQEDTLLFKDGIPVGMQVCVCDLSGNTFRSKPKYVPVDVALDGEVLE